MKRFLIRGILGMIVILCVNYALDSQGFSLHVGLNEVTFLTSGSLGLPGVALLYGIMALKFL